jgi:DNA repair photolyase
MAVIRETLAKSILGKSGISDYCVNCYTGCLHNCIYCYARFMKRFTGHDEPWGQFLDIKVNAPEILAKQVRRNPPGSVFFSSVCDAYQPAEQKYELSRRCLAILLDAGYHVGILTKSALVARDLDIMRGRDNVEIGMTITTMDESIRTKIEPAASSSAERINTLRRAADAGVRIYTFLGPFMPFLTDTEEQLDRLIGEVSKLPIDHAYADKLNARPGVWNSVLQYLHRYHPELVQPTRRVLFNEDDAEAYKAELRERVCRIAEAHGIREKLNIVH